MTLPTYLRLSTSHPDPEIAALARDYGVGTWSTPDELRATLLPWGDYDAKGAAERVIAEWSGAFPGEARHVAGLFNLKEKT